LAGRQRWHGLTESEPGGEATARIDQTLDELASQVRELVQRGEASAAQATRVQEGSQAIQ